MSADPHMHDILVFTIINHSVHAIQVFTVNRSTKPNSLNIKVSCKCNNSSTTTKTKHKHHTTASYHNTYTQTYRYWLRFPDCALKKNLWNLTRLKKRWQKAGPSLLIFPLNKSTIQWSECNNCYLSASWGSICLSTIFGPKHSDQSTHTQTHPACSLRLLIVLKLF